MKCPPVFTLKTSKNLLKNRALRRSDPTIRQIKNGKVTTRWTDPVPETATKEEQIAEIARDVEAGESLLSEESLQKLDKGVEDYVKGNVSEPVDVEKMQKLAESL